MQKLKQPEQSCCGHKHRLNLALYLFFRPLSLSLSLSLSVFFSLSFTRPCMFSGAQVCIAGRVPRISLCAGRRPAGVVAIPEFLLSREGFQTHRAQRSSMWQLRSSPGLSDLAAHLHSPPLSNTGCGELTRLSDWLTRDQLKMWTQAQ